MDTKNIPIEVYMRNIDLEPCLGWGAILPSLILGFSMMLVTKPCFCSGSLLQSKLYN